MAGTTPLQLAEIFGFTPGHISRILQSPLFEAEVARLEAQADMDAVDIGGDLRRMAARCLEILDENLHKNNGISRELQTKTAFDVLDRAGFGKKEQPAKHLHLHAHEVRKVEEMSKEELYEDIIDLINEDD